MAAERLNPAGRIRFFYLALAFIQACGTSGIIFGWPKLEQMFIHEGVYKDHCKAGETKSPCDEQLLFFNTIYTIGVFTNNGAPLLTGIFLDNFGPKLTTIISAFLFACGCALFTIQEAMAYAPAFALLGFAGPGIYVAIMHTSNLFPGNQAKVLSFYSGTFTVSGFIFMIFSILQRHNKWFTMQHLFVCYIIILVPIFLVGAFVWPSKPFKAPVDRRKDEEKIEVQPLIEKQIEKPIGVLYEAKLKLQLMSPPFWVIVLWVAVTNLHIAFFLGTSSYQFPGGRSEAFAWIWDFGFVAIPFYGYMLDKKGVVFSILISNILLLIFSIVNLIPNDPIQYVGFVLVSCVNVGVWGIFYTFLAITFGFNNYGTLLGVACSAIAVVGASQHLLMWAVMNLFGESFVAVNFLFLVLTVLVFFTPFYLWRGENKLVVATENTNININ